MTEIIDVMNCSPIKSVNDLPPGDWVMEPKLDGFRLVAVVEPGAVRFYTRSKKSQDGKLPHIESFLLDAFPPGTVLDGEIVALVDNLDGSIRNDFEYVQSVMLSKPETSRAKQELNRPLKYIIFDMMRLGSTDLRQEPQRDRVRALNAALNPFLDKSLHVAPSVSFPAEDVIHEALLDKGFEGSVVKDANGTYVSGARGHGWFKNKAQPTCDCVIVGYKPGKGKFAGLVGAVFFGQPLFESPLWGMTQHELDAFQRKHKIPVHVIDGVSYVERGHASGMDDEERAFMSDPSLPGEGKRELIGTVIEVGHNGIFPNGVRMRHPQFLRFRPDKSASDVDWHDK